MADDFEPVTIDVDFDAAPMRAALRDLQGLADGFGRSMTTAFRRSIVDGKRFEDVLRSLALGLSARALDAALAPLSRGIGGLLGGIFGSFAGARGFAKGGVIGGGVTAFASGGTIAAPTYFPLGGSGRGLGLAGEAGPEAILPLARGADGKLGVRGGGAGGTVNVTFNVTARDAESFRRSEAELSAMLARAVARGRRGM